MSKIAIFDTGAGFLQWIGEAASVCDALRSLQRDSGDWHPEGLSNDDDDVHVYHLTDEQAMALQAWADAGSRGSEFPHLDDDGQIYTVGEVMAMLSGGM